MLGAVKSLALWMALLGLALTTIAALNKPANEGLPLVHSALKDFPKEHMLYSPCEGTRYAPRKKRNVV